MQASPGSGGAERDFACLRSNSNINDSNDDTSTNNIIDTSASLGSRVAGRAPASGSSAGVLLFETLCIILWHIILTIIIIITISIIIIIIITITIIILFCIIIIIIISCIIIIVRLVVAAASDLEDASDPPRSLDADFGLIGIDENTRKSLKAGGGSITRGRRL